MLTSSLPAAARANHWIHAATATFWVGGLYNMVRASGPAFPLDDAYITLHNGKVLLDTPELNFPGAPAPAGATSMVHLTLLAAFSLFLSALLALQPLSLLVAAMYVTGVSRMAPAAGCDDTLALQAEILAVLVSYTPYHLLNGRETGLAMAMLVWALAWSLDKQRLRALPFQLALAGLTLATLPVAVVRYVERQQVIADLDAANQWAGLALDLAAPGRAQACLRHLCHAL